MEGAQVNKTSNNTLVRKKNTLCTHAKKRLAPPGAALEQQKREVVIQEMEFIVYTHRKKRVSSIVCNNKPATNQGGP